MMSTGNTQASEQEEGQDCTLSRNTDDPTTFIQHYWIPDEEMPNVQLSDTYALDLCCKPGSRSNELANSPVARGYASDAATCSRAMNCLQDQFTSCSPPNAQPFKETDPEVSEELLQEEIHGITEMETVEETNMATSDLVESDTDIVLRKDVDFKDDVNNELSDICLETDHTNSSVTHSSFVDSNFVSDIVGDTNEGTQCGQCTTETEIKVKVSDELKQVKVELYTFESESVPSKLDTKLEIFSEDEEVYFDANSAKSGAESSSSKEGSPSGPESSSSKEESPSGPSCSGTSRASHGINSLSSDSESNLPSINLTLPIKKRKREIPVEVICSASSSDDERGSVSEIDYANLTPEEIKSLIDEAKRYGSIKRRCKCPKKKWSELPIVGPIESSGKCTIGKGDWSENINLPCPGCEAGICRDNHKRPGRRGRRKSALPRIFSAKSRPRGTIGHDVPIIDLSDTEEAKPNSSMASEVTLSTVPVNECIVLSSSEDDDDIVCEAVIKTDEKNQPATSDTSHSELAAKEIQSPDVVVLQPTTQAQLPCVPQTPDSELWPDLNIDLENWDETINLLANIVGPPNVQMANGPQTNPRTPLPERPSTPEGWSCPICLEAKTAVNEIMSTTCGHVFCGNCIRSAVKIHKKCPTCRKKLTAKQFHKIFL